MRPLILPVSSGVAIGIALGAACAGAQVVPDSTQRDTTVRLRPVAVTADRLPAAGAVAPYAIAVRTGAALPQGTPALALDEALRTIPGVQVDNRHNYALGERISIRGAGARAQFGVRGVRVLVDGLPATLPDGQTTLNQVDLASLSRVEVVRGPVASLFGNAAGGAVLLETTPPPDAPLAAEAAVTGGSDGLLRTRGAVGGRRGGWQYGASASRVAVDGYRTHSDAENRYGSARVGWIGRRDVVRVLVNLVDYEARNPGSLSDSLLRVQRYQAFANNVRQRTGESGRQQQGGLQWRRGIGPGELEVTGWTLARTLDNPIPVRVIDIARRVSGGRTLYRASWSRLALSGGVEHEVQRDDRRNYVNQQGERGALVLDQVERVRASGAFVQASAELHRTLHLTGGLRRDGTRFSAADRLVTADNPDDSGGRTLEAWSPSVGVTVHLPAGIAAYASVGTAFETPTTTELANRPDGAGGFNPALAPQRTVAYEVGARRVHEHAAVHVALFRALVRDALIPFEVPDAPGRQFFRNAGRTSASGVEVGATTRVLPMLRLDAAYTYTDARFRDYVVGADSFEGHRIPGVAPHRAELSAILGGARHVAIDIRNQSRMHVDDRNAARSPGFTLLDVRAGSGPIRTGSRVALFAGVQNVLGARYNTSVVVNAVGGRFFEPGPRRTFHLGGTVTAR